MRIVSTIAAIILFGAGTVFGFTDNGDNTITDSRTGLVWQKQDDNIKRTWANAITYCTGLNPAGQWRLPNIKELRTIVDNTATNPAINTRFFPNTKADYYSSSSTNSISTGAAWGVDFYAGGVGDGYGKASTTYVRCVRGGQ